MGNVWISKENWLKYISWGPIEHNSSLVQVLTIQYLYGVKPQPGAIKLPDVYLYDNPMIGSRSLLWRHNEHDGVSNHQPHDCVLNRLFRRRSKKTSKLRVTGLCVGNSPGTGEFPTQMASNAENVSIWWRHHDIDHQQTGRCVLKNWTVYGDIEWEFLCW